MNSTSPSGADLMTMGRPKAPYPGLRPFEAHEWSVFFGREEMIDEVILRLADHRLVLIHGSSGSGKSSLVRAGVLPKLAGQYLRVEEPWRTICFRPSGGPLWNLAKEFAELEGRANDVSRIDEIVRTFNRRGTTLSSVFGSLKIAPCRRLCILVDQFEELFRFEKETSREEAELFVDLLVGNARGESSGTSVDGGSPEETGHVTVHIIVTMRSEFLGDCARFKGLPEVINRTQYLVPGMDSDALMRAICRPATLYNGDVKSELAEKLIAEAEGREDQLPLIQHGLMYLWNSAVADSQPGQRITLDSEPLDATGGLVNLLSNHADAVVDEVAPDRERQFMVESLFRSLTDLNVGGRGIRRPQAFRDLVAVTGSDPDKLRELIDALRCDGVSFLTPYAREPISDATMIDISHEALIRCWHRLSDPTNGWLKHEFDDGLIWRSLLVEAHEYSVNKRRILSPATTEERLRWWKARHVNEAWVARYGNNFPLVERLLQASHGNARRRRGLLYGLVGASLLVGITGAAYAIAASQARLRMLADIYLWQTSLSAQRERALEALQEFQECSKCPVMVVVPAGTFVMGSASDAQGNEDERPQHTVTIPRPLAVSKFEVTFDEWDTCYQLGGCRNRPDDNGWGRADRPVINVTWTDAQEYAAWLSKQTGQPYRLLSEAEYEYAARGGTQTAYPWGNDIGTGNANCHGCGSKWDNQQTAPVGQFPANGFGLHDTAGNVSEWVQDCYYNSYQDAPSDGSARTGINCESRVARSGNWADGPSNLRSAARLWFAPGDLSQFWGFRVARAIVARPE